jgi:hypothetical protein
MSEFSTSYHIRVGDSHDVQKQLRQAKLSGLVFGPAHGWLTFVPYANLANYRNAEGASFAEHLARLTGLAVLHYSYAEDHGWTFALARPEGPLVKFACWWEPHPTVERDPFDSGAFASIVPPDAVEPLLRAFDQAEAMREQPAYRFAELLGLPAYKWLSPELAQEQTQDLLDQAGRKLGTKPPSAATRLRLPPDRQLALSQPYLSAREVFDLIAPFMARFKPPWRLTMLSSYGFLLPDGRGIWQARWRYGDGGDTVQVVLTRDGRLLFRAETTPSYVTHLLMNPVELPERWIDSTDIANIVAGLPVPNGFTWASGGTMTLRSFDDHPHLWECLISADRNGVEPFVLWTIYVDAVSGDVLAEQLSRKVDYGIIPARLRLKKGAWVDLIASD